MRDFSHAVPVRPNAGKAIGKIQAVSVHPKRTQDAVIALHIDRVESISGKPNFLASEAGHAIQVTIRRGSQLNLPVGARVQAVISFQGDERGGGYYTNAADLKIVDDE